MARDAETAFCTGSVIGAPGYRPLPGSKPCAKPASRVRVIAPGTIGGVIAYLCPGHQIEARSAGWQVQSQPRGCNPYSN